MTSAGTAPFTDSGPLIRDRAALARRLAEDGYLWLPGLLPPAAAEAAGHQVLALARDAGWLLPASAGHGTPLAAPDAAVWPPDPRYTRWHSRMWGLRPVHALMHHPALLALVEDLIGEPVLVHPRKVLRVVHPTGPGAPPESGWHQDYPGVQGSRRTLTVWTPLTVGSGPPEVRPGSHRAGLLPMRLSNDAIVGWEAHAGPGPVHHGRLRPGDILVLDAATVHRGTPNVGRTLRISADCRYQPLSEPVCEDCVELLGETYTWDEVYDGWPRGRADPLAYYWLRQRPRTIPYDSRPDTRRDQRALAAGRAGDRSALRALRVAARHSADPATAAEAAALVRRLLSATVPRGAGGSREACEKLAPHKRRSDP
ncbi:phytanoyl-CoA dioxygenase family protein [Streptomyces sp. 8N706]|uniref:phytanoyl-CoA dioxygenase family protein n=1 Tax=Streptomyces sp. 8N706 TaxID=3457416 RepID=UPI003FD2532D